MNATEKAAPRQFEPLADTIIEWLDSRARKHDCPGFDCSVCSLHLTSDSAELADLIADNLGAMYAAAPDLVAALEAALIAFGYDQYSDVLLNAVLEYPNDPAHAAEKNRARAALQMRATLKRARGEQCR